MPSHLFVQDADEEEPLAGSQSCPCLTGTEPITLFQSLEALEALMSCAGERKSVKWQSNMNQSQTEHRGKSFNTDSLLTVRTFFHL